LLTLSANIEIVKKLFCWVPRVLAILFTAFISIFALDVFEDPLWPIALLIHLIPSFILAFITFVAWKHEKLGGILFLFAGLATFLFFHSIVLSLPVLVIGILFLFSVYLKK
jgi:hypothetical protein